MSSRRCPECKQRLSAGDTSCFCGWTAPKQQEQKRNDGHCDYVTQGKRCPMPGTLCPFPYSNGPWFCADHWHALQDPRLGEAATRDIEQHYAEKMAQRQDWRDVLIATRLPYQPKPKEQIE